MVGFNSSVCPNCRGDLKYYDSVPRVIRTKGRISDSVRIRRFRCVNCRKLHRELPDSIFPYKQYESEVIRGVLDGFITSDTIGYEDYPCEVTMKRWIVRKTTFEQLHLDQFLDVEMSSEFIFSTDIVCT